MANVFEHCELMGLSMKNRIVRAATNDYSGNLDGSLSEIQFDLYEKLAKSEVATIITANYFVTDDGRLDAYQNAITVHYDRAGITRLCDRIHAYDCRVIMQISHAGEKSKVDADVAKKYGNLSNLLQEEIHELMKAYIAAAKRAKECGVDGVQVHCGHGYLLSQFLYEGSNNRTDQYGGSLTGRCRIVVEILKGIKEQCGAEFPIWTKINCDDFSESELIEVCGLLKDAGVSLIEFSGRSFPTFDSKVHNYYEKQAELIHTKLGMRVLLTGGIRSFEDAKSAIEKGIDLVGLSRPLISEPELIAKWKNNESSRCISCNKCFTLYKDRQKRCVFHENKI